MQKLEKFRFNSNVIPNRLENISSLTSITSFQILSSSLHSLVKNLSKDDFKHLSQEFDNNVLDLVKQK